jgi:beta-lactam-binding protein with PASTA domain
MSTFRIGRRAVPVALVLLLALLAVAPYAWAAPPVMPDLVGRTEAEADAELTGMGRTARVRLLAGDEVGRVLEQTPAAGTALSEDASIVVVVGVERRLETVLPDLSGLTEEELFDALDGTYFLEVRHVATGEGTDGTVVGQDPAPGAALFAHERLRVDILRRAVRVPPLLGLTEADARDAVMALGLVPVVQYVEDDVGAPGTVVVQDPGSGSEMLAGGRVRLTVAGSEAEAPPHADDAVRVPPVVHLQLDDAQDQVAAVGLDLDIVYVEASAPAHTIVAQHIAAGEMVAPGTRIGVDVARPAPVPTTVPVPPVEGLPRHQAVAQVQAAGLVAKLSFVVLPGETVGHVARQFPPAGTGVAPGTYVLLRLPATAVVPNLLGHSKTQAVAMSLAAGLLGHGQRVGPLQAGTTRVIDQEVPAGTKLARGSHLHFRYEIQLPPVTVPDVVGDTIQQAQAAMTDAGLGSLLLQVGGAGPLTEVVGTTPPVGTSVAAGTTVTIRFKRKGLLPVLTAVPDLIGKSKAQAQALLAGADLNGAWSGPHMLAAARVSAQDRPAGAMVPKNTTIHVTFQLVLVPVPTTTVPDLIGKTKAQAIGLLNGAQLNGVWQGPHNLPAARVSAQSRPAGSVALKNSTITVTFQVVLAPLPNLTTVPDLVGKTKAQAQAALQTAQLGWSWQGPHNAGSARVSAQSRPAGSLAVKNSIVAVTFQLNVILPPLLPNLTTVPNLMGKTRAQAQAALQAANLAWNWQGPHASPLARVSAQNRPAGTLTAKNTVITVTFQLNVILPPVLPNLRTVPNVVGKTEMQARAAILGKQLVPSVVKVPGFPPPMFVKSQSPAAGTVVPKGSSVVITIKN